MIYVLTDTYRQFQNFLQEFHLREHFGHGGNREGQCVSITHADQLRGLDRGIVFVWGTQRNITEEEIRAVAMFRDIPVIEIPDLRRERYLREHPERAAMLPAGKW